MDSLSEKGKNLVAGFAKCGIYPLDKQQLLSRLAQNISETDVNLIGEAFLNTLQEMRKDYISPNTAGVKRKKN